MRPIRTIRATAPIRICDNGGWTDTRVAQHGKVFNIAVQPFVVAEIDVFPRNARESRIVLDATNYDIRYALDLNQCEWGPHPLLEATVCTHPPPDDVDVEIRIASEAPAGASTGTSAAVVVALVGALDRLTAGGRSPYQIAYDAHAVETGPLGGESGIQDQLCAALGGINFIEITEYPRAVVHPLELPDATRHELERRLSLIYFGHPHSSHAVHTKVMQTLEGTAGDSAPLAALRQAAIAARDAVLTSDFHALGRAMRDNTHAQAALHADLVSADACRVIDIAAAHTALGWKVNGAGGDGGSMTLLGDGDSARQTAMIEAIEQENPGFRHLPITLSRVGLHVSSE